MFRPTPTPTLLAALAFVGVIGGCRQPTVGVQLVVPSEQAFLHAAVARIDVYDGNDTGARSPDAICRSLSTNPPSPPGGVQLLTSANAAVCEFAGGGVALDDVGVGRRVIFVEAEDFDGQAILRGCLVVDLFGDDETLAGNDAAVASDLGANALVDVPLAILPAFPAGAPGACESIADKCEEQVSCRP